MCDNYSLRAKAKECRPTGKVAPALYRSTASTYYDVTNFSTNFTFSEKIVNFITAMNVWNNYGVLCTAEYNITCKHICPEHRVQTDDMNEN